MSSQFLIWLLVIVIVFILVFVYFDIRNRNKKAKKYEGKFIGIFITNVGGKFCLCTEEHGEVELPPEYSNVDKSTITGFTWFKNVETNKEEKYYVQSEHRVPVSWPPERKPKDRVKMDMVIFKQGIPLPIVGIMCEKWTPEMLTSLATTLIGLSSDRDELRAMSAQDSSFWNNIEYLRKQIGKLGTTQIASFVAAGAAGIGLILIWQLTSKWDAFIKSIGG